MTREEMREKVKEFIARGCGCVRYCKKNPEDCGCARDADAAIAIIRDETLEEAAREMDAWGDIYGDNAARAIRALKEGNSKAA